MASDTSTVTSKPLHFNETELTLRLPGNYRKSGAKRTFSDTIDLKLGGNDPSYTDCSIVTKSPPSKERGPPVRSSRKNLTKRVCKYVKVEVDGAPYLRKVDLELYSAYRHLLFAFIDLFPRFTIRGVLNKRKLTDHVDGMEYVPTYKDKDGDWMLVGDVPWKMFVESCKRIKLMKNSEVVNGSDQLFKNR